MHGFTLGLPEDYRVHGQDIVAISFFAIAPDHNDGGPLSTDGLSDIILDPGETPPVDPALEAFWTQSRSAHPRLHRMTDELGCCYAAILMTEDEYRGPLCEPPAIADNALLNQTARPARPAWLDKGAAYSFMGPDKVEQSGDSLETTFLFRSMQGRPEPRLDYCLPFSIVERTSDPNAGKKPSENWDEDENPDYEDVYTDTFELKEWAKHLQPNHLGGTMSPMQGVPDFGPYHVGFEEYFGGYNFGSGNAQIDLKSLQIDWAC